MSHGGTTAFKNAAAASHIVPVIAVEISFSSYLRVCSADRDLSILGKDFAGVGRFGQITEVTESSELQAYRLQMALYGIPRDLIGLALAEHYQDRAATAFLALLDPTTYAVVANPIVIFSGTVDTMEFEIGHDCTVMVNVESVLADWERPRIRRYTDEDQQAYFPGDTFFKYVDRMVETEIKWGRG